jgi:two-component system sensor histidine kinase TctE
MQRLLLYTAAVQVWLLLVLAFWLRHVIAQDLRPLAHLEQAVEQRDAADLASLPPELTRAAPTREVRRLGEAVNSLLERLQRSLAAQREFAGNVAHELRTPLAGIRMHANHALGHADPAAWPDDLRAIAQAESRARRLVDQLLALARADEVGTALPREPVALDALARELVLRFLPRADALGVDLGAEGLDESVQVLGDAALVEGILNNLIDNALRYGRGAGLPRITVALRREGDGATLSVSDNGPGLQGDSPAQLAQRWAQGPEGRRLGEGAGLGLAIVRRYAELLGAAFTLETVDGGGLCARLRFEKAWTVEPAAQSGTSARASHAPHEGPANAGPA